MALNYFTKIADFVIYKTYIWKITICVPFLRQVINGTQEIETAQLKLQLQNVQQEMSSLRQQLYRLRSQRHSSCHLAITIASNSRQATHSAMNEDTSVWSTAIDTATIELTKQSTLPPASRQANRHINKVVNKFVARLLRDSSTDFSTPCESTGTKFTLNDISEVLDIVPATQPSNLRTAQQSSQSSISNKLQELSEAEELLNDCVKQLTFSDTQSTISTFSMSSLPSLHSPLDNTICRSSREGHELFECTRQLDFSDACRDTTIIRESERQLGVTFTVCSSPQDSAFGGSFSSSSSNTLSCVSSQPESIDTGFASVPPRPSCVGAEYNHIGRCTNNGSNSEDCDFSTYSINSIDSDSSTFLAGPLNRGPITQKNKDSINILKQMCCVNGRTSRA